MTEDDKAFLDFVSVTIIHILLGEKAFGMSPGSAEINATFRAFKDEDMDNLKRIALERIR